MAAGGRKKRVSKASKAASDALRGADVTPEATVSIQTREGSPNHHRMPDEIGFMDRTVLKSRLTWRAVIYFMIGCIALDIILWAAFEYGLGRCYGVLCLLS